MLVNDSRVFFTQLIPVKLQQKWQKDLEAMDSKLGGTVDKPISSLLIMLETPEEMVVLCSAGELYSCHMITLASVHEVFRLHNIFCIHFKWSLTPVIQSLHVAMLTNLYP